jgi:DNA-binding NtrC family response regulator
LFQAGRLNRLRKKPEQANGLPTTSGRASTYPASRSWSAAHARIADVGPAKFPVLIVDDEANQRTALASLVGSWGYRVQSAADGAEALERLREFEAGAVVTDLMMPRMDGRELLRRLRELPTPPLAIVLTAFGSIEAAVELVLELGAFWFLEKPLEPAALRVLLERARSQRALESYRLSLETQLAGQGVLGELVGSAPPMQSVFSLLRQVAPTRATVLLNGESGSGKELAARAIHDLSPRRGGPFVAVNCASLPETLIESELFGHERGAFTGAVELRQGCFELAHGGTLLLDEIGDMPLTTQSKLLRVLEDSRVRRLGGKREVEVDVRLLASTNRALDELVRKGEFREDLYFRLNVFRVTLPPLRERREDLPQLCAALLAGLNRKHGCRVTGVEADVLALLARHEWPGNVRELRNVLEYAAVLAAAGQIKLEHLPALPGRPAGAARSVPAADAVILPVGKTIAEAERELIEATLRHTAMNRTQAAAMLGISVKTLYNKLKEYGVE